MSLPAFTNVIKMMESLPIELQDRIVEHLQEYIDNIQEQVQWNKSLEKSQSQLLIDLQNSQLEDLLDFYILRGIDADFSKGYRSLITYALPTYTFCYHKLNPKGHEPFEYLDFAKSDLELNNSRGASNSLGNTKLAIHLTIEKILEIFGLNEAYGSKNFPKKLEIIKELEIFPTNIISLLNKKRNDVEHKYIAVNRDEVENYIEVAEFLLLASSPFLHNAVIGAKLGLENDNLCYEWKLEPESSELLQYVVKHNKYIDTDIGSIYYNFLQDQPKKLVKKIKISIANKSEWLPAISLFTYLTKRSTIKSFSNNNVYGYTISERNRGLFVFDNCFQENGEEDNQVPSE
jgi:hypothetical protein